MIAAASGALALALALAPQEPVDAEALWRSGRRDEAITAAEQALLARPDDAALRERLARFQMGTHRYAAALATSEAAPDALRDVRAQALYLLGRYDEALPLLDPDDPLQTLMVVDCHEVLGDAAGTLQAVERAESVLGEAHPELLTVRGRRLAADGRFAEAEERFRAALDADPLALGAAFGLGQALLRLDRRDEALAVLEEHRRLVPLMDRLDAALQAADIAPFHAPSLAALGDAQRDIGRLEPAQRSYALATECAGPDELTPIVLRHARLLAEDLGQLDAAVALLDAAGERVPDPRLPVRAGDLLAAAGRHAAALERYVRASELRPGDPQIEQRIAAARAGQAGAGR